MKEHLAIAVGPRGRLSAFRYVMVGLSIEGAHRRYDSWAEFFVDVITGEGVVLLECAVWRVAAVSQIEWQQTH